jgi:hypothetical protein
VTRRWKTGRLHLPGSGRRHDHDRQKEFAERLTPLEETKAFRDSPQRDGDKAAVDDTIHVDSSSVRLPEHLVEDEREGVSIFRLEPVVLVILLIMLAFICFVAWQITLMPQK